jgi:hypothetical protein
MQTDSEANRVCTVHPHRRDRFNQGETKVLCTLWQSTSLWLAITLEINRLVLRSSSGISLIMQAGNFQSFSPLRGAPVLLAVSASKSVSLASYRLSASIGGTQVVSESFQQATLIKPTEIRFGDASNQLVESMLWYGGRIHENETRNDAQMAQALRNLEMFIARSLVVPPGGGVS